MQVDWITVSAQIVNFLILVWLLKRFLYGPVVRAMDRREQRIAARLGEAREREEAAEATARHHREESEALARERDAILAEAEREAGERRRELLEEARAAAAECRSSWAREVAREKEEFLGELRRRAAEAIAGIARKALADLADSGLEERIVERFIAELGALDDEARAALAGAERPVRIAGAFDLSAGARRRLTRAVHEALGGEREVEYDRAPDLLCGIELGADAQRLGWNLAAYMDELTARVEEAFRPLEPAGEEG